MLDTASDATLMKMSVSSKLNLHLKQPKIRLQGITGSTLAVLSETVAHFKVSAENILTHKVAILDDNYLSTDILLGMDILSRCGPVTVAPNEMKVVWGGKEFEYYTLTQTQGLKGVTSVKRMCRIEKIEEKENSQVNNIKKLQVCTKITIPHRSTRLTKLKVPFPAGKNVIVTLQHSDICQPLPIYTSVDEENSISIPLINETNKKRKYTIGTILGSLECTDDLINSVEIVSTPPLIENAEHQSKTKTANDVDFSSQILQDTRVVRQINETAVPPIISNAMLPDILDKESKDLPRIEKLKGLIKKQDFNHLTREQRGQLRQLLLNYEQMFILDSTDIGTIKIPPQEIPLADPTPVRGPQYRHPDKAREIIHQMLAEMKEKDIIESSTAAWLSPIVLVSKPDGSKRMCLDYRKVNQHLEFDVFPLPRLDELVDNVAGHQFYATLDLKDAYYQVVLGEKSRDLTTFSDGYELWRFKRLPFGLTVSPAIFTRAINQVIAPLAKHGFVRNYLDDVVVYAPSYEKLLDHLGKVFSRFLEMGVKLNLNKCHFGQRSVKFLGHIISAEGIKPDPGNVEGILQVPPPSNLKEIRRFLGMTGFYRKCIPEYAKIASPLTQLTRKDVPFSWTPECQSAFEKLKLVLSTAPVLHPVDYRLPFELHTDASGLAVGAALHQRHPDGSLRPIGFFSKKLRPVETRYSTTDREALGIVLACRFFHHFLWGSKVTIKTDHKALVSVFKHKTKSPRMTRWALEMREYNFLIEFCSGRANVVADQLSRVVRQVRTSPLSEEVQKQVDKLHAPLEKIAEEQDKEERWRVLKLYLKGGELPRNKYSNSVLSQFELEDDVLYYVRKLSDGSLKYTLVVPKGLKKAALYASHDGHTAAHMGQHKTISRLEADFYWPGYRKDCKEYVQSCDLCQQYKGSSGLQKPWQGLPEVSKPLERISIDLTDMYTSHLGYRYVLSIIDHYSRFVNFYPLRSKTAKEVSQNFTDFILSYGTPRQVLADNGAEFQNVNFKKLCEDYRIKLNFVTPYHPRGNSVTERVHKSFKTCLAIMTEGYPNSWPLYLKKAQYALNTAVHTAIGVQPHFAFFSRHISRPFSAGWPRVEDDSEEGLLAAHNLIKETNSKMSSKFREVANRKRKDMTVQVNDLVWVKIERTIPGTSRKLNPRWAGPYTVVKVFRGGSSYELTNPFADGPPIRRAAEKIKKFVGRPELLTINDTDYANLDEDETSTHLDLVPELSEEHRHLIDDDTGKDMDMIKDDAMDNEILTTGISSLEDCNQDSTNEVPFRLNMTDTADRNRRYPIRQRRPVDRLQY